MAVASKSASILAKEPIVKILGWMVDCGVRLTIVADASADALAMNSLYGWLCADHDLRRQISISPIAAGSRTQMGTVDVLNVVLTHTVAIGNLILAYLTWRSSRPASPHVSFRVGGVCVTVLDDSPGSVAAATRAIEAAMAVEGSSDDAA
ncbi:effector-associated constant component EACC1 [Micromonospora sp. I033]